MFRVKILHAFLEQNHLFVNELETLGSNFLVRVLVVNIKGINAENVLVYAKVDHQIDRK